MNRSASKTELTFHRDKIVTRMNQIYTENCNFETSLNNKKLIMTKNLQSLGLIAAILFGLNTATAQEAHNATKKIVPGQTPPTTTNSRSVSEGFEDGFLPPCWTQIDADGDGQGWFLYSLEGTAYEGMNSAASASWTNGTALTPDNYLVSPQLTIGSNEELTFYVAAQDTLYAEETYGVFVSTTGNTDPADFTDELISEFTPTQWTLKTIDMSAYAGQDVYIAFRHYNTTDQFYMKIDDITLPGTLTNECVENTGPVVIDGSESFEDSADSLPDCWQTVDADGDGYTWNIISSEEISFDGMNSVRSESYRNGVGALTPDNYLITPSLEITDGDSLYYVVKAIDGNYPAENYSVLVSTTGTEIADFTDEIFSEVLEDGDYHGRSADLSSFAGQTIYIAFRHYDVTDQFAMVLDAIYLPGVTCNPTGVRELAKFESTLYPNPATNEINITSTLKGDAVVSIFDATGRLIMKTNVFLSNQTLNQNISDLEKGMYTVEIRNADGVATSRFVKQ